MQKGEATEQFAASMHLVLDLADKYQHDSKVPHILDVVAQFLPASKLWPRPQKLQDYWSSDAGTEFLDKCFSIPKISQYFRTRSHVTMVDIDGWHARDLIDHYSLMTILTFLASFVRVLSSLTVPYWLLSPIFY